MVNTATTAISREDMKKVIEIAGHEPNIMDFGGGADAPVVKPTPKQQKPKVDNEENKKKPTKVDDGKVKDAHKAGLEYTKESNFSRWYSQVITKAEMIEYYDISGCYILRPLSFFIWENIQ